MHSSNPNSRYIPTSPLSPRLPNPLPPPTSPQRDRRPGHQRQASPITHMTVPRYHPSNFQHAGSSATPTPTSNLQSPTITLNRSDQPMSMESASLMREKQREFLERSRFNAKIAASPMGIKPDAPRLDPLGSPKGNVTPLALEEAADYFEVAGAGKLSPATSPGGRSSRSDGSGKSDSKKGTSHVVDVYS